MQVLQYLIKFQLFRTVEDKLVMKSTSENFPTKNHACAHTINHLELDWAFKVHHSFVHLSTGEIQGVFSKYLQFD